MNRVTFNEFSIIIRIKNRVIPEPKATGSLWVKYLPAQQINRGLRVARFNPSIHNEEVLVKVEIYIRILRSVL